MSGTDLTVLGVFLVIFKAIMMLGIKAHWDLVYKIVPAKFEALEGSLIRTNSETIALQRETIIELHGLGKKIKKCRRELRNARPPLEEKVEAKKRTAKKSEAAKVT